MHNIKVQCHSGHAYAQRPESFIWEGAEYKIEKIEREWLEPGERHFLVKTEDDRSFELCYHEREDSWSLKEILI